MPIINHFTLTEKVQVMIGEPVQLMDAEVTDIIGNEIQFVTVTVSNGLGVTIIKTWNDDKRILKLTA